MWRRWWSVGSPCHALVGAGKNESCGWCESVIEWEQHTRRDEVTVHHKNSSNVAAMIHSVTICSSVPTQGHRLCVKCAAASTITYVRESGTAAKPDGACASCGLSKPIRQPHT